MIHAVRFMPSFSSDFQSVVLICCLNRTMTCSRISGQRFCLLEPGVNAGFTLGIVDAFEHRHLVCKVSLELICIDSKLGALKWVFFSLFLFYFPFPLYAYGWMVLRNTDGAVSISRVIPFKHPTTSVHLVRGLHSIWLEPVLSFSPVIQPLHLLYGSWTIRFNLSPCSAP